MSEIGTFKSIVANNTEKVKQRYTIDLFTEFEMVFGHCVHTCLKKRNVRSERKNSKWETARSTANEFVGMLNNLLRTSQTGMAKNPHLLKNKLFAQMLAAGASGSASSSLSRRRRRRKENKMIKSVFSLLCY